MRAFVLLAQIMSDGLRRELLLPVARIQEANRTANKSTRLQVEGDNDFFVEETPEQIRDQIEGKIE